MFWVKTFIFFLFLYKKYVMGSRFELSHIKQLQNLDPCYKMDLDLWYCFICEAILNEIQHHKLIF